MAESGGVSGILGTESETPAELSIPETLTQLDPTAAALAAEASKSAYTRRRTYPRGSMPGSSILGSDNSDWIAQVTVLTHLDGRRRL